MMDAVERIGWNLSAAGVTVCQDLCKEKGLAPNGKNLSHVALDLDLKAIAAPILSTAHTHGGAHNIDRSATVLQIQRVKNVAVPSGKQHNPSPSKRLLRLQLSDGHMSISAAEIEGPIERLSPVTPPGTKIKITGHISVINGFILLRKSSTQVLGGTVELLLQKWNMHKAMPDNISRDKGEDGAPQYVKFSKLQAAYVRPPKSSEDHGGKKPQKQPLAAEEEAAPTRELMELPASYRMGTNSKKEREAKGFPRGPPPPTALTADIEDLVEKPITSGVGRGRGRGRGVGVTSDGRRDGSDSRGQEGRGRGRGRGRRHDRDDDEDDYYPQRRKESYQLCDFIEAPVPTKKEEDVMKDYQYSAVSDQYYPKPQQTENVLEDYDYDPATDQYYPKTSQSRGRGRGRGGYGEDYVHHFGQDYSHHETSYDSKNGRKFGYGGEGNRGRGGDGGRGFGRGRGRGSGEGQRSDFDGGRRGRGERQRSDFDGGRGGRRGSWRGEGQRSDFDGGRRERGEGQRSDFGGGRRERGEGQRSDFGGGRRERGEGQRSDFGGGRRERGEGQRSDFDGGRNFDGRERSNFDRGGGRERSNFDKGGGREGGNFDKGGGREGGNFDKGGGREGGNFDRGRVIKFDGGRERGNFDEGRERSNFDSGRQKEGGRRRFGEGKEGERRKAEGRGGYKSGFEARVTSVGDDERGYHQRSRGMDIAPNDPEPWAHLNTSASVPSSAKKV